MARSLVGDTVEEVLGVEVVGLVGARGVGAVIPILTAALATSPFYVMIPTIDQHLE